MASTEHIGNNVSNFSTRTLLLADPHAAVAAVEELHLNCWVLGKEGIHIEIGMEIKVRCDERAVANDLELQCYLPVPCDGALENLTDRIPRR